MWFISLFEFTPIHRHPADRGIIPSVEVTGWVGFNSISSSLLNVTIIRWKNGKRWHKSWSARGNPTSNHSWKLLLFSWILHGNLVLSVLYFLVHFSSTSILPSGISHAICTQRQGVVRFIKAGSPSVGASGIFTFHTTCWLN